MAKSASNSRKAKSASKFRKRTRVGYKRKPKGPDWSIDGEYLVWNRNGGIRIHTDLAGSDSHYFSDKNESIERRAIKLAVQIAKHQRVKFESFASGKHSNLRERKYLCRLTQVKYTELLSY